jgi:hypothetical protein
MAPPYETKTIETMETLSRFPIVPSGFRDRREAGLLALEIVGRTGWAALLDLCCEEAA